jgi:hypothetical protein
VLQRPLRVQLDARRCRVDGLPAIFDWSIDYRQLTPHIRF